VEALVLSKRAFAVVTIFLLAALAFVAFENRKPQTALAGSVFAPAYTQTGDLLPPAGYREWIYLTSGIDMSYAPKTAAMQDHSMFDNVFVDPAAWRSFVETGTWPDRTVMVLEVREARSKASINQAGHFQGIDVMGFEVHVKDQSRFPGGWAFFDFDSPQANGKLLPQDAPCYSCHLAHGAVDTTFVQFYPTLLPIALKKGKLSAAFLKENAEGTPSK
jgi:hypothetical protein